MNRYLVNASATSALVPKFRDIEIHGDLLGKNGEWKRFELTLTSVDRDSVLTVVRSVIAESMPGYQIQSWWKVN